MSIWIKCGRSKSNIYPNLWSIKVFAQIYILEFVLTSKDNQMRQIMHSGNGQNEQAKYSMSSPILSNYTKNSKFLLIHQVWVILFIYFSNW